MVGPFSRSFLWRRLSILSTDFFVIRKNTSTANQYIQVKTMLLHSQCVFIRRALLFSLFLLLPAALWAQNPPRLLVMDFVNTSRDRHTIMLRTATDAVVTELGRGDAYQVVRKSEVESAAKKRGMRPPFSESDLTLLARDLEARYLMTGEVSYVEPHIHDKQREIEVGLIVRVRDLTTGDLINGAADRGLAQEAKDGSKTDAELILEACAAAAVHVSARVSTNRPLEGTLLSSASKQGIVMFNRGASHGVQNKQEFNVYRNGRRVGRVRAFHIYSSYTEMTIVEPGTGIQAQDKAIAVFMEPKFPK